MLNAEAVKRQFADALSQISFSDPVGLDVYCDGQIRIVYVTFDTNIISAKGGGQSTELNAGIDINGAKKLGDLVRITGQVSDNTSSYRMQVSADKSASSGQYFEGNVGINIDDVKNNSNLLTCSCKVTYNGADGEDSFHITSQAAGSGFSVSLNADGTVTEDDSAKSYRADFSNVTFQSSQSGEGITFSLKGSYGAMAKTENIPAPNSSRDLLSMDDTQLYTVLQDIYTKLTNIPTFSNIFGSVFY